MADLPISGLPSSTTPLAGTEVLPIVQSSTTRQVSVANLTAGRAVAASTLALGTAGSTLGTVSLSGSTSGTVTIQPAAAAGTYTLTLPNTAGTNGYALTTDGSGVLSWSSVGGGSGTVTSVDVSGGSTGLTTSGGPIVNSGTITLGGTLAIGSGGTGQTTANAALNALLPSQATASGKVLTSDGTNTSWTSVGGTGTVTSINLNASTTGLLVNGATSNVITSAGTWTLSGTLAVANGGTGVTTSTGTGSVVLSTSPTLVTPVLGTPTSGTLTNCTGLPISTGVSGLGTNVATFLATPTSANLAAAVTNETGSGALVFATSPTLVTPVLGTPTSGTLTNCTGLPISTGVSGLGTNVATFLATPSSANLAAAVTDETGSGALVFGTSPTLTTPVIASITNTGTLTLPTSTDTLVGRATTDTLTNKRVTPRVQTNSAPSSPQTPASDTYDQINYTSIGGALTLNAPSGTPTDGQKLLIRFLDDGTGRALTWTTGSSGAFRAVGITLPTTTTANKTTYVGCVYNSTSLRWDAIATGTEA